MLYGHIFDYITNIKCFFYDIENITFTEMIPSKIPGKVEQYFYVYHANSNQYKRSYHYNYESLSGYWRFLQHLHIIHSLSNWARLNSNSFKSSRDLQFVFGGIYLNS